MTTMSSAYRLQMPPTPPKPVPGCVICANLARKRAEATAVGDYSRASDCNVRMRGHTHRTAPIPH